MTAVDAPAPTVADALRTIAVVQAFAVLAKKVDAQARDFIRGELDCLAELTGAAPSLPVAGLGRATLTSPGYRVIVDDHDELGRWVEKTGAGEVIRKPVLDGAAIQHDVDRGDKELIEFLTAHGYLREETFVPQATLDGLLSMPRKLAGGDIVDPTTAQPGQNIDGQIIDPATGQALPARAVAKSDPVVQVRIDAQARLRAEGIILARVPELLPGGER